MPSRKPKRKPKTEYRLFMDSNSGLWYASPKGVSLQIDWRRDPRVISLGYPREVAYADARRRGLIPQKRPLKRHTK